MGKAQKGNMMKIATVVGARPQFIKAAVVSRILRLRAQEILIHTGQHYDHNMSDIFFEELEIPKPDYNLGISGGSHGQMTGAMLAAIEEVLIAEKPDALLVYGDTNSTLAAALAAVKLHIPVCHAEAGNRLGTFENPEEVNRICTDHVSTKLLACTESAMDFLAAEGLSARAELVGDPMYDAFLFYGARAGTPDRHALLGLDGKKYAIPERFYYLTCHRQENTDEEEKLVNILRAMDSLDVPTIYPVHPRNRERAAAIKEEYGLEKLLFCQPVGYLTSVALVKHAEKVVTDSGGLQREAFFAGKQCVTVFDYVVWPETMRGGRNRLAKPDAKDILAKLTAAQTVDPGYRPFGDGHAGDRIACEILSIGERKV